MSLYVASYDISDDRRRMRVARYLLQFGSRLQLSVYEVLLDPGELNEFRRELGALLSEKDEFMLVPVDERGTRGILTWHRELAHYDAVVLV